MKKENYAILFLAIIYLVGLLGIGLDIFPRMKFLTPINLLLSLFVMLSFEEVMSKSFIFTCLAIYFAGLGIEIAGVQTGKIFGEYQYGEVLGPKILGTPFMIGVNWLLLVYCSSYAVNQFWPKGNIFFKSAIGASIITLLDIFIEPIAIKWNMWTWVAETVPLQNYISWWVIGYVMILLLYKSIGERTNKVAFAVLILQLIFFGLLNL